MRSFLEWWTDVHLTRWGLWAEPKPPLSHRMLRSLVTWFFSCLLVAPAYGTRAWCWAPVLLILAFSLILWIQSRIGRVVHPHRYKHA